MVAIILSTLLINSADFRAGRCWQACWDEMGVPGKWEEKASKCYCQSELPIEYINAKKTKVRVKLNGTDEL